MSGSLNLPIKNGTSFRALFFIYALFQFLPACSLFTQSQIVAQPDPYQFAAKQETNRSIDIFWVGHATMLIRFFDRWIFTDPNFSSRIGLIVKRYQIPGINPSSINPVDYILISHTHFDHLDQPSLNQLTKSKYLLVPNKGATYIPDKVAEKIISVQPYSVLEDAGLKITAVPVKHFGGRWLVDNLWDGEPYTGYMIEYQGQTVFFGGDTGYDEALFKELGQKFRVNIALLPIGPTGWVSASGLGNSVHVNARGALQIFKDLQAQWMIPMHYGTFYREREPELIYLQQALAQFNDSAKILIMQAGQGLRFSQQEVIKLN